MDTPLLELLARRLDRAYTDGYLDRDQTLTTFSRAHTADLIAVQSAGHTLPELVGQANIGAPDYWASILLEGVLLTDEAPRQTELWLRTQSDELAVAIASRVALRVIPFLANDIRQVAGVRSRIILPCFYLVAGAWVGGIWPDHLGDIGSLNTPSLYPALSEFQAARAALNVADAFIDPAFSRQDDLAQVAYETIIAAEAAIREFAPSLLLQHRTALVADTNCIHESIRGRGHPSLLHFSERPLWPSDPPPPIQDLWHELKRHLLAADEDWEVWTAWYEERIGGRTTDSRLELIRLTTANETLPDTPAVVNRAIRDALAKHLTSRFPSRDLLVLNPNTGRIGLAEVALSDRPRYARVCDQLRDIVGQMSDARFANIYAELADPLGLLSQALEERYDAPIIVHRRVVQTAQEIERVLAADATLAKDFNIRILREDLRQAITAIPDAVPSVAEELRKHDDSTMVGLSASDRNRVIETANLIRDHSEPPVVDFIDEGVQALDQCEETQLIPDGASQRIFTLGWIMAKLPALRAKLPTLVKDGVARLEGLEKLIASVQRLYTTLLRLFLNGGS